MIKLFSLLEETSKAKDDPFGLGFDVMMTAVYVDPKRAKSLNNSRTPLYVFRSYTHNGQYGIGTVFKYSQENQEISPMYSCFHYKDYSFVMRHDLSYTHKNDGLTVMYSDEDIEDFISLNEEDKLVDSSFGFLSYLVDDYMSSVMFHDTDYVYALAIIRKIKELEDEKKLELLDGHILFPKQDWSKRHVFPRISVSVGEDIYDIYGNEYLLPERVISGNAPIFTRRVIELYENLKRLRKRSDVEMHLFGIMLGTLGLDEFAREQLEREGSRIDYNEATYWDIIKQKGWFVGNRNVQESAIAININLVASKEQTEQELAQTFNTEIDGKTKMQLAYKGLRFLFDIYVFQNNEAKLFNWYLLSYNYQSLYLIEQTIREEGKEIPTLLSSEISYIYSRFSWHYKNNSRQYSSLFKYGRNKLTAHISLMSVNMLNDE